MAANSGQRILAKRRIVLAVFAGPIAIFAVGSWFARAYLPQAEFSEIWEEFRSIAYTLIPLLACLFVALGSFRPGNEGPLICMIGFGLVAISMCLAPVASVVWGTGVSLQLVWPNLVIAVWSLVAVGFVVREWAAASRAG